MDSPRITFRVNPPGLKKELEKEAAKRNVTTSWLANRLLEEGLEVLRTKGLKVLRAKVA